MLSPNPWTETTWGWWIFAAAVASRWKRWIAFGWLAPAGDTERWIEALGGLVDADVDAAGTAARSLWESRYSPAVALDGLLDAYRF